MTIERDFEFGGHTLECDICHAMFSSEDGEPLDALKKGMVECGWAVDGDQHACFNCTGRDPNKDWSKSPAQYPDIKPGDDAYPHGQG
ncbi:MAG: hypothetical protein ACR2RE_19540 [Geminicoccaceae bacterium]